MSHHHYEKSVGWRKVCCERGWDSERIESIRGESSSL